ncbi:MAG: hypothetical protein Pars2KO_10740 [Parasphingorhabdus sp.]
MFNINFYIKRAEGVSTPEFKDFWFGKHAESLREFVENLGVRALIKHEILPEHPVGVSAAEDYGTAPLRYDAVDTWKFNDIEALKAGSALADVQAALASLAKLESEYVDFAASNVLMTVDLAQFHGVDANEIRATPDGSFVKIFYVVRVLDCLTRAGAQLHWNTCHGALSRQDIRYSMQAKYNQCHAIESTFVDQLAADRGYEIDGDLIGHAEGWIDAEQTPKDFPEDEQAEVVSMSMDDIDLFADKHRGNVFVCHEHYVIDKPVIVRPLPKFFGAVY